MFSARFPLAIIQAMTKDAQDAIKAHVPVLVEKVGIFYLQEMMLAYNEKARGGTGSDGVHWAALKQETIDRKNSRAPGGKAAAKASKAGKAVKRPRATPSGKARPSALSSEIGVDTGLQRSSAKPGFQGNDGKGGNVFEKTQDRIVIGFGRDYSEYFDEDRTLIPEELPREWVEEADLMVEVECNEILGKELEG